MKNCEFLLKKKIPFQDVTTESEVTVSAGGSDVQYHYTFKHETSVIGYLTNSEFLSYDKAFLVWLQKDHTILNESEKELIKRAVSDLGRLNDRDIYVRWYISQPSKRVLEIGEQTACGAYTGYDPLWKMRITDTGFEFNGMLQDQRYTLKELGIL